MEHGADIDKAGPAWPGESPNGPIVPSYPLAEYSYDFEAVLYLLEAGADYKRAEWGGISFLERIRQAGEQREKKEYPFRNKVDRQKFDAVRAWLEEHDVDVRGK